MYFVQCAQCTLLEVRMETLTRVGHDIFLCSVSGSGLIVVILKC